MNKENYSKLKENTIRTGYMASDAEIRTFADTNKKVANVDLMYGSRENNNLTTIGISGWNGMADIMSNIKKGQRWEFTGELGEQKYFSKKESKEKTALVMIAKSAVQQIKKEIQGRIIKIETEKQISSDHKVKEITIVSDGVNPTSSTF